MIRLVVIQTGRWCSAKMRCFPRKNHRRARPTQKRKRKKKRRTKKKNKNKKKEEQEKKKKRRRRRRRRKEEEEGREREPCGDMRGAWEGVWRQVGSQGRAERKGSGRRGKKTVVSFPYLSSPSTQRLPFFSFPVSETPSSYNTHNRTPLSTVFPFPVPSSSLPPLFPHLRFFLFFFPSFLPSFLLSFFLSFFHFRFAVMVLSTMPLARGLVSLVRVSRRVERDVSWVLSGISSAHKPRQKKCCGFSCSRGCSFSFSTATARERERGVKREGSRVEVIVDV